MVELRSSFYGFTCARYHRLDRGGEICRCSRFVYARVFVMIETAYIAFEGEALAQASGNDMTPPVRRITKIRSYMALGIFSTAAAISFLSPLGGFALVCCVLFIYLNPVYPNCFINRCAHNQSARQSGRNRMKNSVAILTGASQGIGRATAIRLARDFYAVVVAARNAKALEKVAAAVQKAGAEPLPLAVDLSEVEASKLWPTTLERFGRIDVLLNIPADRHAEVGRYRAIVYGIWSPGCHCIRLHGSTIFLVQPMCRASNHFLSSIRRTRNWAGQKLRGGTLQVRKELGSSRSSFYLSLREAPCDLLDNVRRCRPAHRNSRGEDDY